MKNLKRILAVALAVMMIASLFAGCGGNSGKNVLKFGFDANFPPMGFKDDSGEYVGFDIDVAKEVVKIIEGYDELELIPIDWDSKNAELESGNIDMIWNGFTMHVDNRDKDYTWTEAYMENAQVICVATDSDIQSLNDLKDKSVAAQKDSSGLAAFKKTEIANSAKEIKEFPEYDTALMNLESGAVDAVVIDETVIGYKIAQGNDKFRILDDSLAAEEYGVAFLKGNTELRDKVQTALETLAENGKLAEISTNWFSSDITTVGK
ncbi:MAG TPA: amino acid ABC transporter substrate-binding protein [Clostridia bacterium]|nr:amino acid ABC transporter substrate-binding protein [Clostridia bacterium]